VKVGCVHLCRVEGNTVNYIQDGLFGMAASGWISLHKNMESNIHKIQNKKIQKYKPTV